jgi:serine phosphatase RsbU (regulator of sigma subunit)
MRVETATGKIEEFGEERLKNVIEDNAQLDAAGLQKAVIDAISAFKTEEFDDTTLMVIEAKPISDERKAAFKTIEKEKSRFAKTRADLAALRATQAVVSQHAQDAGIDSRTYQYALLRLSIFPKIENGVLKYTYEKQDISAETVKGLVRELNEDAQEVGVDLNEYLQALVNVRVSRKIKDGALQYADAEKNVIDEGTVKNVVREVIEDAQDIDVDLREYLQALSNLKIRGKVKDGALEYEDTKENVIDEGTVKDQVKGLGKVEYKSTFKPLEEKISTAEERIEAIEEKGLEDVTLDNLLDNEQSPQPNVFYQALDEVDGRPTGGDHSYLEEEGNVRRAGIFDLTGHGTEAAFYKYPLTRSLRKGLDGRMSIPELADLVNSESAKVFSSRMFAGGTVMELEYNARTGKTKLTYSNIGNKFYILRADGSIEFTSVSGKPVGVSATAKAGFVTTELNPGDKIIFFTDGVTEAMKVVTVDGKRDVKRFDKEIGLEATIKANSHLDSAGLQKAILDAIADNGFLFDDDVTLMVLDAVPPGAVEVEPAIAAVTRREFADILVDPDVRLPAPRLVRQIGA